MTGKCTPCGPNEFTLAAFVGGEITDVDWEFYGEGLQIQGVASGDEAYAFDDRHFTAQLTTEISAGGLSFTTVDSGTLSFHTSKPLIGAFAPGNGALVASANTPLASRACPCTFNGSDGEGEYSLQLTRAGEGTSLVLGMAPEIESFH